MKLLISARAEKQLKKLAKIDQIVVVRKIRSIRTNPSVVKKEKLKSFKNIYRVRVGDIRVVYQKKTQEIFIISIGHRREIYKLIKKLLN